MLLTKLDKEIIRQIVLNDLLRIRLESKKSGIALDEEYQKVLELFIKINSEND